MHIIEVDQSNKIEDSGDTFLAFSNGESFAIRVPARVKRAGLRLLRQRGKSKKMATLMLFAVCVFLLLEKHLDQVQLIIVDNEYDGREADIRSFILECIKKRHPHFQSAKITIRSIGKKSGAHDAAWRAYKKKRSVDRTVTLQQIHTVIQ